MEPRNPYWIRSHRKYRSILGINYYCMNIDKIRELQIREYGILRSFSLEELKNYHTAKSYNEARRNIQLELRRLGA